MNKHGIFAPIVPATLPVNQTVHIKEAKTQRTGRESDNICTRKLKQQTEKITRVS